MLLINNLQKSYRGDIVLDGINFKINSGEIAVIMGPSGCGKSTFIRCINRLVEPDAGEIYFKDIPIHKLRSGELEQVRRNIGFVFQHFNLIQRLTVGQNVELGPIKGGCSREEARERSEKVLRAVGLQKLAGIEINNLSGGEKQRVGIARALVMDPDLILLDEPTAALDPILVRDVLQILEDIASSDRETSLIVITHEVAFARRVADKIYFMDRGRFIESGPPDQVFDHPRSWIGQKYRQLIDYESTSLPGLK